MTIDDYYFFGKSKVENSAVGIALVGLMPKRYASVRDTRPYKNSRAVVIHPFIEIPYTPAHERDQYLCHMRMCMQQNPAHPPYKGEILALTRRLDGRRSEMNTPAIRYTGFGQNPNYPETDALVVCNIHCDDFYRMVGGDTSGLPANGLLYNSVMRDPAEWAHIWRSMRDMSGNMVLLRNLRIFSWDPRYQRVQVMTSVHFIFNIINESCDSAANGSMQIAGGHRTDMARMVNQMVKLFPRSHVTFDLTHGRLGHLLRAPSPQDIRDALYNLSVLIVKNCSVCHVVNLFATEGLPSAHFLQDLTRAIRLRYSNAIQAAERRANKVANRRAMPFTTWPKTQSPTTTSTSTSHSPSPPTTTSDSTTSDSTTSDNTTPRSSPALHLSHKSLDPLDLNDAVPPPTVSDILPDSPTVMESNEPFLYLDRLGNSS